MPIERGPRAADQPTGMTDGWPAISAWATDLAASIGTEHPGQHVTVFVPDPDGTGLRLAGQVWGAGEDIGAVVVGDWLVPLDGSVCGRVYRTGLAALCTDVAMDPDYRAFPGGRMRSSLTVPIGPPDGVLGVINVEAPWIGAFSMRDYERMTERAAAAFATYPEAPLG